jgi:hypothetical protein
MDCYERKEDMLFFLLLLSFDWKEDHLKMLENKFKTKLVGELESLFPGCIITHMDPNEIQGIPDLLILYRDKWAALEGKKNATASARPNQPYYVELMNKMSFASFIYPENKDEVLDALYLHFMN